MDRIQPGAALLPGLPLRPSFFVNNVAGDACRKCRAPPVSRAASAASGPAWPRHVRVRRAASRKPEHIERRRLPLVADHRVVSSTEAACLDGGGTAQRGRRPTSPRRRDRRQWRSTGAVRSGRRAAADGPSSRRLLSRSGLTGHGSSAPLEPPVFSERRAGARWPAAGAGRSRSPGCGRGRGRSPRTPTGPPTAGHGTRRRPTSAG